jgi:hypothetical protein
MDYRTGHSIISGTKYSLTWPGRLEEQRLIEIMVSFYKFSNRNSARFWSLRPNTTVASAKVMILMV